jgi:hypothetical protein
MEIWRNFNNLMDIYRYYKGIRRKINGFKAFIVEIWKILNGFKVFYGKMEEF